MFEFSMSKRKKEIKYHFKTRQEENVEKLDQIIQPSVQFYSFPTQGQIPYFGVDNDFRSAPWTCAVTTDAYSKSRLW